MGGHGGSPFVKVRLSGSMCRAKLAHDTLGGPIHHRLTGSASSQTGSRALELVRQTSSSQHGSAPVSGDFSVLGRKRRKREKEKKKREKREKKERKREKKKEKRRGRKERKGREERERKRPRHYVRCVCAPLCSVSASDYSRRIVLYCIGWMDQMCLVTYCNRLNAPRYIL